MGDLAWKAIVLFCLTYARFGIGDETIPHGLRYSCFVDPASCCFDENEYDWVQRKPRCKFDPETQSYPCAIKLGASDWLNSFVNVHLAKIFIEEFLGYPVEINADYEKLANGDTDHQCTTNDVMWDSLESGEIDAVLEVWETGKEKAIHEYITQRQSVIRAPSSLGVIGGIGWYFPEFLVEQVVDKKYGLACEDPHFLEYWRSMLIPGVVELFKNQEDQLPCCQTDTKTVTQIIPCMPAASLGGTPVKHGGIETSKLCDDNPTLTISTFGGRLVTGSSTWTSVSLIRLIRDSYNNSFCYSETKLS